ncbi:hypothetical protein EMIT0324P_170061 [Pseudomonas chlororaphis]
MQVKVGAMSDHLETPINTDEEWQGSGYFEYKP